MQKLIDVILGFLALFFRPQEVEQATPEPEKAAPTEMSPDGLAILKYFESCRLEAYWDADGKVWTIGWGDTGPDVVKGLRISQAEADERLQRRLAREFVPGVLATLTRPVTQAQLDGIVDLAYNIGVGAFQTSTLVRLFNAGDQASASEQFLRWNKSGGKVLLGLRRRRAADRARFLGETGAEAIKIGAAIVYSTMGKGGRLAWSAGRHGPCWSGAAAGRAAPGQGAGGTETGKGGHSRCGGRT